MASVRYRTYAGDPNRMCPVTATALPTSYCSSTFQDGVSACRPPHRSRRTCGAEAAGVRTRQWGPTGQFVILTSSQLGATTHRCAADLTSTPGTAARCRLVVACASCLRSGARWTVQGITMSQHQIAVIVGSVRRLRWWESTHGAEAGPARTTPDPVSVRHTPTGYASAGSRHPSALQAGGCLSGLRAAPSGRSQDGTEAQSRLSARSVR